jgi:uncharacterized protein YndB with AHSA1/START domain
MTLPRSEREPEVTDGRAGAAGGGRAATERTEAVRDPARADAERVTRSVELDAPPAVVWDALTEEALLAEWLADEVEIEAEPGGELVCRYADGEERRGEVELVEEVERLAWSWRRESGGPSRVELILDAVAERTRLTVIETGPVRAADPLLLAAAAGPRLHVVPGPMLAASAGPGASLARARDLPLAHLRAAVRLVLA